jgi:uncharacterized protein (DUF433 family)
MRVIRRAWQAGVVSPDRERAVAVEQQVELGVGQYTPDELARYARVSRALVKQWFGLGSRGRKRASPEKYLTFVDFAEVLALRAILLRRKLPVEAIREAVTHARKSFQVERPLAAPHKIYFLRDKIVLSPREGRECVTPPAFDFVEDSHQRYFEFDAHGKPIRYWAYPLLVAFPFEVSKTAFLAARDLLWLREWADRLPLVTVRMDPQVRFGEPTVHPTGYTAETLWEAVEVEGDVRKAAEAYRVSEAEVLVACAYVDHLRDGPPTSPPRGPRRVPRCTPRSAPSR